MIPATTQRAFLSAIGRPDLAGAPGVFDPDEQPADLAPGAALFLAGIHAFAAGDTASARRFARLAEQAIDSALSARPSASDIYPRWAYPGETEEAFFRDIMPDTSGQAAAHQAAVEAAARRFSGAAKPQSEMLPTDRDSRQRVPAPPFQLRPRPFTLALVR